MRKASYRHLLEHARILETEAKDSVCEICPIRESEDQERVLSELRGRSNLCNGMSDDGTFHAIRLRESIIVQR